jgi:sulfate adenylyltransferase
VGNYYGPFDAHRIFDTLPAGSVAIQPIKIDIAFYCYRCKSMATGKTCPHGVEDQLAISGTRLREMFANREAIPEEFSRKEVIDILRAYYDGLG